MTRFGPDPEDRIVPCYAHEEPNPWCPVCKGSGFLTGIEKQRLETLVRRDGDDEPAYDVTLTLAPDGSVRTRPATVLEVVERIVGRCVGEVE